MKNKEVENVLQALIAYLRDVGDFMEAVQTRIEEGFTTEDKTEYNNDSYEILKNILEEAKVVTSPCKTISPLCLDQSTKGLENTNM